MVAALALILSSSLFAVAALDYPFKGDVRIHPAAFEQVLEAVMNSVRNGLGMRETEITREPSRLWNPHSYAIFAQVHNTL
jgi:hypothetical protein